MKIATRTRNLYDAKSDKPFKVSRSAIELFTECPRCFYLDRRLGIARPPGFPFNLNSAVDGLLKKEFDLYRERGKPHPLMAANKVDAVPFDHPDLETWRSTRKGLHYHHEATNLVITGALDDVWIDAQGKLIVVDYKATAKNDDITVLDQHWHQSYKRQLEVYQWLLKRQGFKVSSIGYWVYANGDKSAVRFDATLKFRMTVIPYRGNDKWVDSTIVDIKKCLNSKRIPRPQEDCDYCAYRAAASGVERQQPASP